MEDYEEEVIYAIYPERRSSRPSRTDPSFRTVRLFSMEIELKLPHTIGGWDWQVTILKALDLGVPMIRTLSL